jgi:hypothetical protein
VGSGLEFQHTGELGGADAGFIGFLLCANEALGFPLCTAKENPPRKRCAAGLCVHDLLMVMTSAIFPAGSRKVLPIVL